jgi:hypothetical protein
MVSETSPLHIHLVIYVQYPFISIPDEDNAHDVKSCLFVFFVCNCKPSGMIIMRRTSRYSFIKMKKAFGSIRRSK